MKCIPHLLAASIFFIVVGWSTGSAFLGIIGCFLLIPVGCITLGAFIWSLIQ
jgi:hypothetical protein